MTIFKWLFSKSILTNGTIFEGPLLHQLTNVLRLTIIYPLNFLIFIPTILFLKLHINILTHLYWEFICWLSSGEEASKWNYESSRCSCLPQKIHLKSLQGLWNLKYVKPPFSKVVFVYAQLAQSRLTLCMDCNLPGSSVHEIFQAKHWSGFNPGVESLASLALAGRFFTTSSTWKAHVQKKALYYLATD